MQLSHAIHLFITSLNYLDNDTQRAYLLDLNKFLTSIDDIDIADISRAQIIQYLGNLQTKSQHRVSVSTENRHYATLKRFWQYLTTENYLADNIFHNIPRRKPNKDIGEIPTGSIIRTLSKAQVQMFLQALKKAPLREQVLFTLVYTTGLRISEALALQITDINFSEQIITIRSAKGNKPRQTFIGKSLKPVLTKYIKYIKNKSKYLFFNPDKTHQPLSYGRARQLFTHLTKNLMNPDGSKITIHQLRHTFASERAGYIDSILLMNLMGHNDIRTTLRYAKASTHATRQAFNMFENLDM